MTEPHCERCCPTHREKAHERLLGVILDAAVATTVVVILRLIGV